MSNPTSNYSFQMPTASDLVTDLPADFEIFGQAVDTQMKTNADAATQKATLTTKGDIYAATGASTPARLAVGANNTVLTADSTAATGIKWASAAVDGPTFYAYLSSNQTVTSGVITKVQCNTEEYDLGSNYDNATNYRFTPTTAGIYQINSLIQANGSSGTTIWIYKNGSVIREGSRTAGAGAPMSFSTQVTMNGSTDYIEFFAQVASGTTIYGGQATTGFGAAYLRSN